MLYNSILKTGSIYLLISAFNVASQLVMVGIYVSSFTPEEYGIYALMSSTFACLTIFSTINLNSSVRTFIFDFEQEQDQLAYLRSTYTTGVLIASLVVALLFLFGPTLFEVSFKTEGITFETYGRFVVGYSAFSAMNYIYFEFLRCKQRLKEYAILTFAQSAGSILFQVVFITYFDLKAVGAFMGMLLSAMLIFLYVVFFRKLITLKVNKDLVRRSLRYSALLIPALFIQWFLTRADRFVIEKFIGLEEVGIYALLMNVSLILSLVATSLLNSIRPSLYGTLKKLDHAAARKVTQFFAFFLGTILLISTGIYVLVQFIDYLPIDQAYHSIKSIIGLALVLFCTRILVRFINEYLLFLKRSDVLSGLTFLALVLFVLLIWLNADGLTVELLLRLLIGVNICLLLVTLTSVLYLGKQQKSLQTDG